LFRSLVPEAEGGARLAGDQPDPLGIEAVVMGPQGALEGVEMHRGTPGGGPGPAEARPRLAVPALHEASRPVPVEEGELLAGTGVADPHPVVAPAGEEAVPAAGKDLPGARPGVELQAYHPVVRIKHGPHRKALGGRG